MPGKWTRKKTRVTNLPPLSELPNRRVVDARGIVRTLPRNPQRAKRMVAGIRRKLGAIETSKVKRSF